MNLKDKIYAANRMRNLLKRTKQEGCLGTFSKIVSVPLTFFRDYTIPMAEQDTWDRNRAAIVPIFIVLASFWLNGLIDPDE